MLWNDVNFDVSNVYLKNEFNLVISDKYDKNFFQLENKQEVIALLFYLFIKLLTKYDLIMDDIKLDDFNFYEDKTKNYHKYKKL